MSIIEYHDVITMDTDRKAINKRLASYENDYESLMKDKTKRESYLRDLRKQQILKNRIRNFMSMDHIRFDKKNFAEKWIVNFVKQQESQEFFFTTYIYLLKNIKDYKQQPYRTQFCSQIIIIKRYL